MSSSRILLRLGAPLIVLGLAGGVAAADGGHSDHLPADYWQLPLKPQGDAPPEWTGVERSLAPPDCGRCHARQYEDWQLSRHSQAFSPGLVGELVGMDATGISACMRCHAPLAEQVQTFLREFMGRSPSPTPALSPGYGNGCPSCHVRAWRHYGPPTRTGETGALPSPAHGGAQLSADFERSQFCAGCHQFPVSAAVNGKPLENTYVEWKDSRFAAEGRACQSCHMPDRRHLWRGIHDPEMVRTGIAAKIGMTAQELRFTVTNAAVGHDFPTYVTPRVILWAVPLDHDGRLLLSHAVHYTIERQVEATAAGWIERSDTRLAPGSSATLVLPWGDYGEAQVWMQVEPDSYYHRQVYPGLLQDTNIDGAAKKLISIANQAAGASPFRLFETVVHRPR